MGKRAILLGEDDSDDIELIRRVLARRHLVNEPTVVMDGKGALDYVWGRGLYEDRDTSFQPGLALLDARLPKPDGWEVLQRLPTRPEIPGLPVVMPSNDDEEKEAGLNWMPLGGSGIPRKGV